MRNAISSNSCFFYQDIINNFSIKNFEWKNKNPKEDSRPAFTAMYNRFGGVPRKQKKIVPGAPWYAEEQNTLFELASNSILEEISG